MVAQPGRQQSGFGSGELDPRLHARFELKYFETGCALAENVEFSPQGGFRNRNGLRHVGSVPATASRLITFRASDGEVYDLVFSNLSVDVWQASNLATVVTPFTDGQLSEVNQAQRLDTLLLFHKDVETRRIKHIGPANWSLDIAPFENLPNHDYGAAYTNGVSAVWEIEFIGLSDGNSVFTLTVSGEETTAITFNDGTTMTTLINDVIPAIESLPSVEPGIGVVKLSGKRLQITFDGVGNEGDGWAVSARVINKSDAAVTAIKRTPGVAPGEVLLSSARGWPRCGVFYQQRLIMGGFRSLSSHWIASIVGDYYNFDDRIDEANGSFLVPMDTPGGEALERIVAMRNLLLFTNSAEYWLSDREISKTTPPNHVESSRHGTAVGTPIVENEGAAVFCHENRGVLGEFRYTDVDGNFVADDLSLLASHMIDGVGDMAVRRAELNSDGNLLAVVQQDGSMRLATLLRRQEVTAFGRVASDGTFQATACNGNNELGVIAERPVNSSTSRRLERFEAGLLFDGALTFEFQSPTQIISGLDIHEGAIVWVEADRNIFGPFLVAGNQITLPVEALNVTIGRWTAPKVTTLPPSREIREGSRVVLRRRGRIHSVQLDLIDTTSVAIAVNGGPLRDIDLLRYGAIADVADLDATFTGTITVRGLTGYADEPNVTISQIRPGTLSVRALTIEAAL